MQRKRCYWHEKNAVLIETSTADMRLGREHFEATLKQRLENAGIACNKLSQEELYEKVEGRDQLTKFAKMVTQFIQKAKQKGLSPTEMQRKVDTYEPHDERESVFLQLASRVYKEYEQEKEVTFNCF